MQVLFVNALFRPVTCYIFCWMYCDRQVACHPVSSSNKFPAPAKLIQNSTLYDCELGITFSRQHSRHELQVVAAPTYGCRGLVPSSESNLCSRNESIHTCYLDNLHNIRGS